MKTTQQVFNLFFAEAIRDNWRMSWKAWQQLIEHFCGWYVHDNDSGFTDADIIDAKQAETGFNRCTIGPVKD